MSVNNTSHIWKEAKKPIYKHGFYIQGGASDSEFPGMLGIAIYFEIFSSDPESWLPGGSATTMHQVIETIRSHVSDDWSGNVSGGIKSTSNGNEAPCCGLYANSNKSFHLRFIDPVPAHGAWLRGVDLKAITDGTYGGSRVWFERVERIN